MVDLGKRIKIARIMSDTSTGSLADEVGISRNFLSLLENNKQTPSFETLCKIAFILRLLIYILALSNLVLLEI